MMVDLNEALADVQQLLVNKKQQLEALETSIQSLLLEQRGLELAIARHGGNEAPAAANGQAQAWQRLSRTDAVLRVLDEADGPLGPAQITARLREAGRDDERNPVAAALAYLKRNGRVDHVDTGKWASIAIPEDHTSADPLWGGGSP